MSNLLIRALVDCGMTHEMAVAAAKRIVSLDDDGQVSAEQQAAIAAIAGGGGGGEVPEYFGLVATGGRTNWSGAAGTAIECTVPFTIMAPSRYVTVREVNTTGDRVATSTTTLTFVCAIEYPVGSTPRLLTYQGAGSMTAAPGADQDWDEFDLGVSPKIGQRGLLHRYITGTPGVPYCQMPMNTYGASIGVGGNLNAAASNRVLTPSTSKTFSGGSTPYFNFPAGIYGRTSRRSTLLLGDSFQAANVSAGWIDQYGGVGTTEPRLGRWRAVANHARGGRAVGDLTAAGVLAKYQKDLDRCTDVVLNLGINGMSANMLTLIDGLAQTLATTYGKTVWWQTIPPSVASGETGNPLTWRQAVNTGLRNGRPYIAGVIDVASVLEDPASAGSWVAGTTGTLSAVIHPGAVGDALVRDTDKVWLPLFT